MPSFNATELVLEAQVAAELQGEDVYAVLVDAFAAKFELGSPPGMLTQLYVLSGLFAV